MNRYYGSAFDSSGWKMVERYELVADNLNAATDSFNDYLSDNRYPCKIAVVVVEE